MPCARSRIARESGLLFPAGDAAALARSVSGLLARPDRRQHMRHAARRAFETRFTAERNYAELMGIYAGVMRRSVTPTPGARRIG